MLFINKATQQQLLSLQTDKSIDLVPLEAGTQTLQIGTEHISLSADVSLESLPWACARGVNSDGQYAESKDQQGNIYRWYWHPPEWQESIGILRGVWYSDKPDTLDKPAWADVIGRDQYGIYADFSIKKVVQRMRWIEPGQFLMGSPEVETG